MHAKCDTNNTIDIQQQQRQPLQTRSAFNSLDLHISCAIQIGPTIYLCIRLYATERKYFQIVCVIYFRLHIIAALKNSPAECVKNCANSIRGDGADQKNELRGQNHPAIPKTHWKRTKRMRKSPHALEMVAWPKGNSNVTYGIFGACAH